MLSWWADAGITMADLAARRRGGLMLWHHDLPLDILPLPWARMENARGADIYIRPARNHNWPLVFLDDVAVDLAQRIARKYAALVIHSSPAGGCHVWLRCRQPLDEPQRRHSQRWLAERVLADRASTSGEHLGRLAGFTNHKRHAWVNVLAATARHPAWDADVALAQPVDLARTRNPPARAAATGSDTSESAREWGWVCGLLEAGCDPPLVYAKLLDHARPRRGSDAARYATHTLRRALTRASRNDS